MAVRDIEFPESSNISGIVYDDDTQELTVTFSHGGVYKYSSVDGNEADGFTSATSAGEYLNRIIKPSHTYERIG